MPSPETTDDRDRWVILYDEDCGFCRWSLAQLLEWDRDRRLRPLPIGSPAADRLLHDLSPQQRAASWHLVAPDGERRSAGAAASPLLRLLPGGRPLASLLAAAPGATERAYAWVAAHRSLLSRAIPSRSKLQADVRIARRRDRSAPGPTA